MSRVRSFRKGPNSRILQIAATIQHSHDVNDLTLREDSVAPFPFQQASLNSPL